MEPIEFLRQWQNFKFKIVKLDEVEKTFKGTSVERAVQSSSYKTHYKYLYEKESFDKIYVVFLYFNREKWTYFYIVSNTVPSINDALDCIIRDLDFISDLLNEDRDYPNYLMKLKDEGLRQDFNNIDFVKDAFMLYRLQRVWGVLENFFSNGKRSPFERMIKNYFEYVEY